MDETQNKEGRLERLKKTLYRKSTSSPEEKRFTLHMHETEPRDSWSKTDIVHERPTTLSSQIRMPFWKKFFIVSTLFFLGALIIAVLVFLGNSNLISTRNVDIVVSGPVSVQAGEELELQIAIENKNPTALESVDFIIEYPEGARNLQNVESELTRFRKSLGRIEPGAIFKEPLRVALFGQAGDEKKFNISLEYRVADSNAIFVKEKEYIATISSSATSLSVKTLSEVISGQEFTLQITLTSNADIVTKDLLVAVEYPFGFSFKEAAPKPTAGNNSFAVGDLPPQGKRVITIRGVMEGQDGESKIFRVSSGTRSQKEEHEVGVVYNQSIAETKIVRPFLSALLFVNGETLPEYIVSHDGVIDVEAIFTNNLAAKLVDVKVVAELKGDVVDKFSVESQNGFYNSGDNTISWDKNSFPELGELESGAQGKISFNFSLLPLFGARGALREPTVMVAIHTNGNRLSASGVPEEIKNSVERKIKVPSDVEFVPRIVYFSGPFQNTGPLPPEVERETTYTVIWTAVNSSNHVSNTKVSAVLPPYVRYMGISSPGEEALTYNSVSREITWSVGRLEAGSGISAAPREVAFQVVFTPSISQLEQSPTIIGQSTFSGIDEFTKAPIRIVWKALTISLNTDPNFVFTHGKVVEPSTAVPAE